MLDSKMSAAEIYDQIGKGYAVQRIPEQRWIDLINAQISGASALLNVGAGTGSYEPSVLNVIALEPSPTMILQRPTTAAPVVRGIAEQLPFADNSFDVAMAVLTVHHWSDPALGLAEMRRVSRKQIIITWDNAVFAETFWLIRDYLPEVAAHDANLPTLPTISHQLQNPRTHTLPVPAECSDGVLGAYWRRPEVYLDKRSRDAMSGLALLDQQTVGEAMQHLRADLDSGIWAERNASILDLSELDIGYRMVVS